MCAVLDKYRPVAANEGGGISGLLLPLEKNLLGDLWETQAAIAGQQERPHKLVSACRAFSSLRALSWTRTSDLLLRRQSLYPPEL